ncbi:MAG: adenosylhomocysteine nucleosidase [Rhodoferax sp.]
MSVAILSALAQEQTGLIEQLANPVCVTRAGRGFWCGELHGHRVVLGLSRVGKVAAATTATTLIEAFGVTRMIFTGVAGGMASGVQVGDVVLATAFVQHDMDASPLYPRYQLPLYGRDQLTCDTNLSAILLKATHAGLTLIRDKFGPDTSGHKAGVHTGLVVSGDRFVSSAAESRALLNALRDAGFAPLAVEMEGAAVAQVCFDYGVPFAALRTISDRADEQAHTDFQQFVDEVASHYARAIIGQLLRLLPHEKALPT